MPIVNPNNHQEMQRYEDFIKNSPYATPTQDTAWSKVKNNWTPLYVYLEEGGKIIAAMSILMVNAVGTKKLAYACKGPVCNPRNVELVDRLMNEAVKYAKEHDAFVVGIDPEVPFTEELHVNYRKRGYLLRNRNVTSKDTIQPRYNMVLDLRNKTADELLQSFHPKTRYNIRLAARKGVKVSYSRKIEDLKNFYHLYEVMSNRHGISYRPYNYFERMLEAFGENIRVYLAEHEGDILAGALAISYGNKTWYAYGGSSNEKRNLMTPHLLQWEMINWALELGKERYDFGGVFELEKSNGLYRFKEGYCHPNQVTEYIGEIHRVIDKEAYEQFISR